MNPSQSQYLVFTIVDAEAKKGEQPVFFPAAFSTIAPFFGVMTVTNIGAHGWKVYIGATLIESCLDTLEDAQAAAESWHRERIESALIVKGE